MKKITIAELFLLIENVKYDVDIRDETDFPSNFSITISSTRETIYLEFPKTENKYDFLLEELKKFF